MKNYIMKYLISSLSLITVISFFAGCSAGTAKKETPPRTDFTQPPLTEQMLDTGEWQHRWMSIPGSRIVVNPYNYQGWKMDKPQSEYINSPKIPLHIGYLDPYYRDGDGGNKLYDTLMVLNYEGTGRENIEAASYSTSWAPHMLGFSAEYNNGLKVEGKDYFYDANTLIREITYDGEQAPAFAGIYYNACSKEELKDIKSTCTISGNTVVINNNNYTVAISFDTDMEFVFYRNYEYYVSQAAGLNVPVEGGNLWTARVKESPADRTLNISVTVLSNLTSKEEAAEISANAVRKDNIEGKFDERIDFWNDYLKKIPIPGSFDIETIDTKGVSYKDVDQMYYEAWVLLAADILPESPETGFYYKQMAAGKPSMWAWGHPSASYTGAWDSIYSYHMYSFIDPEVSWDCFKGLMSLVERSDDPLRNGMLAGESLPVNRARTAWLLYEMLPDKTRLESVFEDIDLNLSWALEHTY